MRPWNQLKNNLSEVESNCFSSGHNKTSSSTQNNLFSRPLQRPFPPLGKFRTEPLSIIYRIIRDLNAKSRELCRPETTLQLAKPRSLKFKMKVLPFVYSSSITAGLRARRWLSEVLYTKTSRPSSQRCVREKT